MTAEAVLGARRDDPARHADVANAIGAALCASRQGEAGLVADVGGATARGRDPPGAVSIASERAVNAGADPDQLETVWIDEIPLAYLDRPMSRLRAKVASQAV